MRLSLLLLSFLFIVNATAQTIKETLKSRMLQVENSLTPDNIYGDTMDKIAITDRPLSAIEIYTLTIASIID